jgi:hypothetical protein
MKPGRGGAFRWRFPLPRSSVSDGGKLVDELISSNGSRCPGPELGAGAVDKGGGLGIDTGGGVDEGKGASAPMATGAGEG